MVELIFCLPYSAAWVCFFLCFFCCLLGSWTLRVHTTPAANQDCGCATQSPHSTATRHSQGVEMIGQPADVPVVPPDIPSPAGLVGPAARNRHVRTRERGGRGFREATAPAEEPQMLQPHAIFIRNSFACGWAITSQTDGLNAGCAPIAVCQSFAVKGVARAKAGPIHRGVLASSFFPATNPPPAGFRVFFCRFCDPEGF